MIRIKENKDLARRHSNFIIPLLEKRVTSIKNRGYVGKGKTKIILSTTETKILDGLINHKLLDILVNANPNCLIQIIRIIRNKYPDFLNKETNIYKVLYNLFVNHGYDKMNLDYKFSFIKDIDLKTCPYCNRSYIYTLDRAKKLKPEIDHFYPKEKYPILAVSFYNLIPSCPTCNGFGAKSNTDSYKKRLKNPYDILDTDFEFDVRIQNINILNSLSNIDLKSVDISFKKKIQSHLDVFKLDELYQEHRDIVLELYYMSKLQFSEKYKEYLKSYSGLNFTKDDLNRFILRNYTNHKNFHKRPLSKLTHDIAKKYKLI